MKDVLESFINHDEIVQITEIKKFQKNEIIFFEGDEPQYFYLLLFGFVKIYKTDNKSNEIVLHNFSPVNFIAEMASFENIKFPATAICIDDCKIALIKKDGLNQLLKTNPKISYLMTKSFSQKIKALEKLINRSLIFDAMTKVAFFIYNNKETFQETKKKLIANELNITPETFSRVLKKLKELKILDDHSNIIDCSKLEMLISF